MLLPRRFLASAIALLASTSLVQNVAAQVTTDCNPLNTTCPPNPALSMDLTTHFNATPKASIWEEHVGKTEYDKNLGAMFTINKQGDSPTLRSKFYFFWGRVEIWMKASHGTGIVSSIMLLSDDLDEIDWEFLGGDNVNATTNYFGKGHPDFKNGKYHPVGGVQDDYHNYTINWTKDALDFYVNNNKVRTLLPKEANNTLYYPQTPMRLHMGIWAGGDPNLPEGTRQWAGGDTDYSKGPYTMYVKSAQVTDFSSGKEYVYSDNSGSWQSIQAVQGESKIIAVVNAPPEKSMSEKWEELPSTAKTAVYAGGAGLGACIVAFAAFYCIRQRRRGARQAKIEEEKFQAERMELDRLKKAGIDPDSFVAQGHEYNAKEMREDGLTDKDSYSVPNTAAATPTAATENEKWQTAAAVGVGAAAGAGVGAASAASANGMRSPMPLLRDGAQSPRSPQSPGFNAPYSDQPGPASAGYNAPAPYTDRGANTRSPAPSMNNYGGARSPPPMGDMRSQSPAIGSPRMANGAPRNYPPGPARSFTSPPPRMASPAQQQPGFNVAQPQPQRSFTTTGFPGQQQPGGYGGQQGGNSGGWNNQGDQQGYWNGGYR